MAVFIACLVLFLAMTGHSSASYCLCKDGVPDQQLQKSIDFACGNGADCSQILQSGPCYNPNTVKDHCNYAVNSYYQRKSQGPGTCDFSGTAAVSQTQPPSSTSTCVYPSTPGNTGTPTSNNGSTSTPNGTITPNPPNTFTPGSGASSPGFGGVAPGTGIGVNPDNNNGLGTLHHNLMRSLVATILLLSGLIICL